MLALESVEGRDERLAREHAAQVAAIRATHRAELDQRDATVHTAWAELELFKVAVRERALRCKDDESWCDAGFNAAMRDLGLPELIRRYRVRVTVEMTVEDAGSEEVAESWAHNALHSNDADVAIEEIETLDVDELEDE
jgi:hypothetical protein